MVSRFQIHRYLDPGESLGEVLFGLIMALTFTVGARLIGPAEPLDARELVLATLGCNIAWGVIDGVLFVLGSLFHRSRRARFFRALKAAGDEREALAAISEEFGVEDMPLKILPEDSARLHQSILAITAHGALRRARVRREDIASGVIVFGLVAATALPAVIPFLLIGNSTLALRLSNGILIVLLFIVGYWWAHYTDANPWRVGSSVMILGLAMVAIAVALGG